MDCLYKMEATSLIGLRTLYINLAIPVVVWLLYFVLLYQTMHSAVSFVMASQTLYSKCIAIVHCLCLRTAIWVLQLPSLCTDSQKAGTNQMFKQLSKRVTKMKKNRITHLPVQSLS